MFSSECVSFASLTRNNIGTVRKLNFILFPINYAPKFYDGILQPEVEDFCKLVYYQDIPVGTICCRLESHEKQAKLYIMTMGVLAAYCSRGVGTKCLEHVLAAAASHTKPKISHVYLHVQTSNEDAKRFYERHGFQVTMLQEDYYKKITPASAWILEKSLTGDEACNESDKHT